MIVKWLKRIVWIVLAIIIGKELGIGFVFIFLITVKIVDFFSLYLVDIIAIKGFQEGKSQEDILKAKQMLQEYQHIPFSPSKPLVTFSQLVLGPFFSLVFPILIAGLFLGWFF